MFVDSCQPSSGLQEESEEYAAWRHGPGKSHETGKIEEGLLFQPLQEEAGSEVSAMGLQRRVAGGGCTASWCKQEQRKNSHHQDTRPQPDVAAEAGMIATGDVRLGMRVEKRQGAL